MSRRDALPASALPALHQFDPRLYTGKPVFNGALVRYRNRWVQTVRIGPNIGTRTMIGWLGEDLRPSAPFRDLSTPASCKEDMRLFVHEGRLWAAYMDLIRSDGKGISRVEVNFCRFDEDLRIESEWRPRVPGQGPWEKNWLPFSLGGCIHFVYSIAPVHAVYRWEPGRNPVIAGRSETPVGGWDELLRGGTPPVYHQGRYVALFHVGNPSRRIGLYEFEPRSPFRVTRVVQEPLLHRPGPAWGCVYAIGLLEWGGRLYMTYGEDDRRLFLRRI